MENRAFKVAGIRNLITKNYKLPFDILDLEALVDDTLGMSENWFNNVKDKVRNLLSSEEIMIYRNL